MRTSTSKARRHDGTPQPASSGLKRIAACVFAAAPAEEDEILGFVDLARDIADRDLSFFLTAWCAERIAGNRIACGDLGIDEVLAAIEAGRAHGAADGAWLTRVAEYKSLADEILIDTLNEFREFEMVVAYSGHREDYAARWAAGMRALARAFPELAGNACPLPAAAPGWRDDLPQPALAG